MAKSSPSLQLVQWQVRSVMVKARDGPSRLEQVYLLLLKPQQDRLSGCNVNGQLEVDCPPQGGS